MNNSPLFTIVTATYNAAAMLPQLLDSLASQTCNDFELVVQDGFSKDTTATILEQYRDKIPHISFVSEPDTGIYDAWNKALSRVQGEWVLFLGADDKIADATALEQAKARLAHAGPNINFAAGAMKFVDESGNCLFELLPETNNGASRLEFSMPAAFPALFVRSRLFATNRFNTAYRIAGDYDWLWRVWKDDEAIDLDVLVSIMFEGGVSSAPQNRLRIELERAQIAKHYLHHVWNKPRIKLLIKSCIVTVCFTVFSANNASKYLDFFRKLRGLPPVWTR